MPLPGRWTDDPADFEVTTTIEEGCVVLALHGRVEKLAAFDLAASLDATIDLEPAAVVLDLSELNFMGAAGVVAVANAEKRLSEVGIELSVRTPSTLIEHLLGTMESAQTSRLERAEPGHSNLDREQMGEPPFPSRPHPSNVAAEDLRRVTAIPTDHDVVDGALRLVVELARTSVSGADGVSVSLLRHGELRTVAASDETIMEMDTEQYATREGPCVDASLQGRWFHAESLDIESRWPSFTPRARALGIKAILSSPLKAFDVPVGALEHLLADRLFLRCRRSGDGGGIRPQSLRDPERCPRRCDRFADSCAIPRGLEEPRDHRHCQRNRYGARKGQ